MREIVEAASTAKLNTIDRIVAAVNPAAGVRRLRSRAILAMAGAYHGASKKRKALSEWSPSAGDADADIIAELPDLRERSRDLERNNPLATGAINTKCTSIVGTGLNLNAQVDRDVLGWDDDFADAWERRTEAEFALFCRYCDVEDVLPFTPGFQDLSLRSTLINGDVFILTPMVEDKRTPYRLKLQAVEADRVSNPNNRADTDRLAGGIEKDANGRPIRIHVLKGHPGNPYSSKNEWIPVDIYGAKTGRRNVIHLFDKKRVGQTRGVPDLAPVIEILKQMGRYTDAEVQAAVISSFFTVFVKSEYGGGGVGNPLLGPMQPTADVGGKTSDKDYKMGSGAILELLPNEDVTTANPGRPNDAFDPFVLALSRQIGVALQLPYEILVKHFTASYSAAQAALLEAWKFFMTRRVWLAQSLCQLVYELFMTEAVALGRIYAPGFLTGDPLVREAYLGADWIGPARGQIDQKKEIDAAAQRVAEGVSTLSEETAALTGGDWSKKHRQRVKEVRKRVEDGLQPDPSAATKQAPAPMPAPEEDRGDDE